MNKPSIAARDCVVLGAGGHARVLLDVFDASGLGRPHALLDADASRWGCELDGVPIAGGDGLLSQLIADGVKWFVVGVGSVGDCTVRRRLFEMGEAAGLRPLTLVHPSAVVSPSAEIRAGAQLLPGSIVNAGSRIGANVIVNSGAIIEHDCTVGDHAHVATAAALASTVWIGAGAHIGAGAVVRQCIRIGENAIVGAGAVVVSDVSADTVVVGSPARPVRDLKIRPSAEDAHK